MLSNLTNAKQFPSARDRHKNRIVPALGPGQNISSSAVSGGHFSTEPWPSASEEEAKGFFREGM
jgi:hypothetical protein